MSIYELTQHEIAEIPETAFGIEGVLERQHIQRVLRDKIEVVARDTFVLAEEFGGWEEGHRRIDLLAIDKQANLVVVELKRTSDGGHMELQALRYAAMVSTMTFDQAVETHTTYCSRRGIESDARQAILDFLEWDSPNDEAFAQAVKIVLVSADFSREVTTTILWLNDNYGLDVRCVRIKPYKWLDRVLLDIQQVIPLPESTDYVVRVREKVQRERELRTTRKDFTKYDVVIDGQRQERLAKRRAIFAVVRELCRRGISPEQIHSVLSWRGSGLWRTVDGIVDSDKFVAQAELDEALGGPAFDAPRWYQADGELIVHDGRTYAMTKMWGERTEEAIRALLKAFPGYKIQVTPSDEQV